MRNQIKKFTIEPKSYTTMLLYLFFDSLLSTCQKKWKLKNGPRLPTLHRSSYILSFQILTPSYFFSLSLPIIQVWGQTSSSKLEYNKVQCTLEEWFLPRAQVGFEVDTFVRLIVYIRHHFGCLLGASALGIPCL